METNKEPVKKLEVECDEELHRKCQYELKNCFKSQYMLVTEVTRMKTEAEEREDLLQRGNEGEFIAENQKLKTENYRLNQELEKSKNQFEAMESEIEAMKISHTAQIEDIQEKCQNAINKQITEYETENKRLKDTNDDLDAKLKRQENVWVDIKKEVQERNNLLKIAKDEIRKLQKRNESWEKKLIEFEKKFTSQETKIKNLINSNKDLKILQENESMSKKKIEHHFETITKNLENKESKCKTLESNLREKRKQNFELKTQNDKLKVEIDRLCKCGQGETYDKNTCEWWKIKNEKCEKRKDVEEEEKEKKYSEAQVKIEKLRLQIKQNEATISEQTKNLRRLQIINIALHKTISMQKKHLSMLDKDQFQTSNMRKKCERVLAKRTKQIKILDKKAFHFETQQKEFQKKCAIKDMTIHKWTKNVRTLTHGVKRQEKLKIMKTKELELKSIALKKLSDKHKKLSKINLKLESKLNHYQAAYWEVLTKTKEHDREVKDKICEIDRLSKYIDHVKMDKEHIINISNKHQDKIKKLENQIIELNFQIAERSKIDNKPGSQNRMVDLELKVKRLRNENRRLKPYVKNNDLLKKRLLMCNTKMIQLAMSHRLQADLLTKPTNIHSHRILKEKKPEIYVANLKAIKLTKTLIDIESSKINKKPETKMECTDEQVALKKPSIDTAEWLAKKTIEETKKKTQCLLAELEVKTNKIYLMDNQLESAKKEANEWKKMFYDLFSSFSVELLLWMGYC